MHVTYVVHHVNSNERVTTSNPRRLQTLRDHRVLRPGYYSLLGITVEEIDYGALCPTCQDTRQMPDLDNLEGYAECPDCRDASATQEMRG